MCNFENELVVFTNSLLSFSDADGCAIGTLLSCRYTVILCLRSCTEIRCIPLKTVERVLSKNNSQIGRKKCHYYTGVNYQLRVGQFEPSKYDSSGIILKF